jgi:hypothetical protein
VLSALIQSLFGGASLEVDTSDLSRQVQAVAQAQGKTSREVLREELRTIVGEVVATTPPFSRHSLLESELAQRMAGERALLRDIRRVFRPVQTLRAWRRPTNPDARAALEKAVNAGDTSTVAAILGFDPQRVIERARPELHESARDNQGHVPESMRWFVVLDEGSVRDYQRLMLERVGKAKAGWETAAKALGVRLPQWVERHSTPGTFKESKDPNELGFSISNGVSYGNDFGELRILESAMERAEKRLGKRLEDALSASLG